MSALRRALSRPCWTPPGRRREGLVGGAIIAVRITRSRSGRAASSAWFRTGRTSSTSSWRS
eukprot:1859190-Alexandrium_andersonii.AAC.1